MTTTPPLCRTLRGTLWTLAVIGLILTASAGSADAQTPGVYRADGQIAFMQMMGNFAASNQARLNGLVVQINSNRTITLFVPNTFYGSITSNLRRRGSSNLFEFRGVRTVRTGISVTTVVIDGLLETTNGRPTAVAIASRSGNIAAAVINGSAFSSGVTNSFVGAVRLR